MNPFRLDNEIALITGGGTGLGLAMARRIAEAGARVIITGRREQPLKDAANSIGQNASYIVHDIADFKQSAKLIDQTTAQAGASPTILINNAGHNLKKPAIETTEEEFQSMLSIHVLGSFALSRAVAPNVVSFTASAVIIFS